MMTHYRLQDLPDALIDVGLTRGSLTFVHSALFALGRPKSCPLDAIPARIYDQIRQVIGPQGTIAVPTFNFDFCRQIPFDRQKTPSKKMGSFSEFIRTHPDAYRSSHPLQSIAAIGPLAKELTANDTAGAFESGSSFDQLIELDAQILLLGCGFEPISLVHWAEEQARVPYRFWKEFTGLYRDQGLEETRTYRLFARRLDQNPTVRLDPIRAILLERRELISRPFGAAFIERCQARHFALAAMELLLGNPQALIAPIHPSRPTGGEA